MPLYWQFCPGFYRGRPAQNITSSASLSSFIYIPLVRQKRPSSKDGAIEDPLPGRTAHSAVPKRDSRRREGGNKKAASMAPWPGRSLSIELKSRAAIRHIETLLSGR